MYVMKFIKTIVHQKVLLEIIEILFIILFQYTMDFTYLSFLDSKFKVATY